MYMSLEPADVLTLDATPQTDADEWGVLIDVALALPPAGAAPAAITVSEEKDQDQLVLVEIEAEGQLDSEPITTATASGFVHPAQALETKPTPVPPTWPSVDKDEYDQVQLDAHGDTTIYSPLAESHRYTASLAGTA